MPPLYLEKLSPLDLKEKSEKLYELLKECKLCPNECLADRTNSETGECHSTDEVFISSYGPHHGEEPPLRGHYGSGTIFFTNCNLSCEFCQNFDISHLGQGEGVSIDHLAEIMISLQNRGCHNINLVTPTHFTPQIVDALIIAIDKGLVIPLVYNCGGFESVETLKLLEGIIDIYMPDIKFSNNKNAENYSHIKNYWGVAKAAVKEMHRQIGDLKLNREGIAQRGILVRHLILPNGIAGSKKVIDFIAEDLSTETYLNLMDQYHPAFKADKFYELDRRITPKEYAGIINYARQHGLTRGLLT